MEKFNIYIRYNELKPEEFHICAASLLKFSSIPLEIYRLERGPLYNAGVYSSESDDRCPFFIPYLQHYKDYALFLESTFIFQADVAGLIVKNENFAVQHTENNSIILWNCGHNSNKKLPPAYANKTPLEKLRKFGWLTHRMIGKIGDEWTLDSAVYYTNDKPSAYFDLLKEVNSPQTNSLLSIFSKKKPSNPPSGPIGLSLEDKVLPQKVCKPCSKNKT